MNSAIFGRLSLLRTGGAHQKTRDIKEFYDTVTKPGQAPIAGRAWSASLLRQKSFADLHKLWFVLLKEKNMLLTERLHARSTHQSNFRNPMRLKKVKLGMARIKVVLGERSRAYKAAKLKIRQLYEAARREENKKIRAEHLQREILRMQQQKLQKGIENPQQDTEASSAAEQILSGESENLAVPNTAGQV